jgi:hypothetical protein
MKRGFVLSLLMVLVLLITAQAALAAQLSGAIFTTTYDGSRVNANIYEAKEDVYLDGGPGPNAPASAAGLPAGDYYFQVTDPSGKTLLSMDSIECRRVRVNSFGVIDKVYEAFRELKNGKIVECTHKTGIDLDHGGEPWKAITVQLMPYKDTPNNGGVYKVWMTPVEKYQAGKGFHGFIPSWSKTDNYKVKGKMVPPEIRVRKFHDLNVNGVWDADEPSLAWVIDVEDPLGASQPSVTTPATVYNALPAGAWKLTEVFPEGTPGWKQTVVYVNGVKQTLSPTATVNVLGKSGEVHEVVFGNVQYGCVKAMKYNDANANGEYDEGEKPVEGVKFVLSGKAVNGDVVYDEKWSDDKGKVKWCELLPGDYKVTEVVPEGWKASTPVEQSVTVTPGGVTKLKFGNYKLACVEGRKFYDADRDGIWDEGEKPLAGIKFVLTGTDIYGDPVDDTKYTDADGRVRWCNLIPGDYKLEEILPAGYYASTPTYVEFALKPADDKVFKFGNFCITTADFGTKGWWQNKNGNPLIDADDIAYLNGLDPYKAPTEYWDTPFQSREEIGEFLVAAVSASPHRFQLAQQLAAFILNVREYAGGTDAMIAMPGGEFVSAQSIIDSAIAAWSSDDSSAQTMWAGKLDGFNNCDTVWLPAKEACPVVY